MIVGEAPGAEEDARGEPFVGQAGRLLESMLGSLGLSRDRDVFIANVLKCRPPGNRNPEPDEMRQCEPYLHRQIALLQPRGILVMGRFGAQALCDRRAIATCADGSMPNANGEDLPLVTHHPAYLLRNLPDKAKAWADLCLARERFGPGAPRGAETAEGGLRAVWGGPRAGEGATVGCSAAFGQRASVSNSRWLARWRRITRTIDTATKPPNITMM
jgi:DNA polymerase